MLKNFIVKFFKKFFDKRKSEATLNTAQLKIVEGISGTWFYHLAIDERIALCGETRVMSTHVPVKIWGLKTHLNERYCSRCALLGKYYQ